MRKKLKQMENLNAEQIIKDWEYHVEFGKEVGLERDFINYVSINLANSTLTLITAQEQRIKELTQANEMLSESYDHLEKTKDELLAERSRLSEENERLMRDKTTLECVVATARNQAKRKVLREISLRFSMYFGTYTNDTEVKVTDVFELLKQIETEILEGDQ